MDAVPAIELGLVLAVPVIAGLAVVSIGGRTPSVGANPARTALVLFALLVVVAALLSPGGDVMTPAIGGLVAAVVCVWVLVELRRRRRFGPD